MEFSSSHRFGEVQVVSDYGILLNGGGWTFVKLSNRYGQGAHRYTAVHIENTMSRPYGGDSLTLCGRTLLMGSYIFISSWSTALGYRTCATCCRVMQALARKKGTVHSDMLLESAFGPSKEVVPT